jgi:hypothetical protein
VRLSFLKHFPHCTVYITAEMCLVFFARRGKNYRFFLGRVCFYVHLILDNIKKLSPFEENLFWFVLAQCILGVDLYLHTSVCLLSRNSDNRVSVSYRLIFRSVECDTKDYRIFETLTVIVNFL